MAKTSHLVAISSSGHRFDRVKCFSHFSETDIGNQSWYKYVVPCHPSLLGSLIAKSDMKSLIEFVAPPSNACIAQRRLHGVLHKAFARSGARRRPEPQLCLPARRRDMPPHHRTHAAIGQGAYGISCAMIVFNKGANQTRSHSLPLIETSRLAIRGYDPSCKLR